MCVHIYICVCVYIYIYIYIYIKVNFEVYRNEIPIAGPLLWAPCPGPRCAVSSHKFILAIFYPPLK